MVKPGTNYFGELNENVNISQTNELGYAVIADCDGDPNVVAVDKAVYSNGCLMFRNDVLTGESVYENIGTVLNPSWSLLKTSSSTQNNIIFGEVVSGSNTSWTLSHVPSGTIGLAANGQVLILTVDYTISGANITTLSTWSAGTVVADYQY